MTRRAPGSCRTWWATVRPPPPCPPSRATPTTTTCTPRALALGATTAARTGSRRTQVPRRRPGPARRTPKPPRPPQCPHSSSSTTRSATATDCPQLPRWPTSRQALPAPSTTRSSGTSTARRRWRCCAPRCTTWTSRTLRARPRCGAPPKASTRTPDPRPLSS